MKVAIGSDHGGFLLKSALRRALEGDGVDVDDVGCFDTGAVDYPDIAQQVVRRVTLGLADEGMLVCTTGIGMSIAANKYPGIRAALCCTPEMAVKARTHNNANVLVLGGQVTSPAVALEILKAWRSSAYTGAERHERRNRKVGGWPASAWETMALDRSDPEVAEILRKEAARQNETINLIASENYASRAVREAQGSVLTNKYAEGYPGRRWYDGCEQVDAIERLAIERAKRLFGAEHVNVQPHCGSSANMAVYFAALQPGDTLLAMNLSHGGHLTHGSPVNFSGRLFRVVGYGVRRDTERIDPAEIARLALEYHPRLIVVGASSYPRSLDFAAFRDIADQVGARLMVDMAHIAGLVAGDCHSSPVPLAEFVTTTTHKTLRGPRGGAILCRQAYASEVDRQIFPGTQGGPLMHVIAAKAVCFAEALRPEFAEYARQVVRNARVLGEALQAEGFRLVSGGTDTHLLVVDLTATGLTGRDAATALNRCGLIVNKNVIPFDPRPPVQTSGIRIGSPAVTTRGMKEDEMRRLARLMARVLRAPDDSRTGEAVRHEVRELATAFPVE